MGIERVIEVVDGRTFRTDKGIVQLVVPQPPSMKEKDGPKYKEKLEDLILGEDVNVSVIKVDGNYRISDVTDNDGYSIAVKLGHGIQLEN